MEYEAREYERNYRRDRSTKNDIAQQTDFITPVIIVQLAVFMLIFVVFFCFYKKQNETFKQIRAFYVNIMQQDLAAKDFVDGAKSVLKFLSEPRMLKQNDSTVTDSKEELNGAGGEDLLHPDSNASFSPIFLSAEIVKPVESKRITSKFGFRINPVTKKYGFHSGLDLAAPEDTDIKAAFDGVVKTASNSSIRGNYIFLQSGNIRTVYCHCSKLLVKEGDTVKAGETIAKVGSTGQATGPHLHFELMINGIHYNPEWALDYS